MARENDTESRSGTPPSSQSQSAESPSSEPTFGEYLAQFRTLFPRIASGIETVSGGHVTGDALAAIVTRTRSSTHESVDALAAPSLWSVESPVVVSQFADYASTPAAAYWATTVPEVESAYAHTVRYEHHDVPPANPRAESYKLATLGRALQHHHSDELFWRWYNTIMTDGIESISEGYDVATQLDDTVDRDTVTNAVRADAFQGVLEADINTLLGRVSDDAYPALTDKLAAGEPVFRVFVNGAPVQPSYDTVTAAITRSLPE